MSNAELIISLILWGFELIFTIVTRFFLFGKVGVPRWKAFIPIYGAAVAYKVTNMSALWVLSEIPVLVTSSPGLKIPIWLNGLAYGIKYGVEVIFAIQLAKAFHRKTGFMILAFFVPGITQLIASISSKYKYDEHYNRYKYRKINGNFIAIEHVKEEKAKLFAESQEKIKKEIMSEPEPPEKTGALKKFTDFIVEKHKAVLAIVIIFTIICGILSTKVNVNRDLTKYMPESSDTSKGLNIMYDEFEDVLAMPLSIMVDDLSDEEKQEEKEYIKGLEGVASLTYDETEEYNKDNHTLYELTILGKSDSENGKNIINNLQERYKQKNKKMTIRGEVATANAPVLPVWVIGLAVLFALVILVIMSDSYVEPILYLISIGLAVVINKGTNILMPSVSQITNSITSVLQLALSMDYSIMLATEYHREKIRGKSKIPAMKSALSRSFTAISASSVTTIVGMLVLILMSFTIGRDLGIVLAKGVLLCLLSIFTALPALLILFDGLIEKTRKKAFEPKLDILGKISYKIRKFAIIIFLLIMGGAFAAQLSVGNLFTNTDSESIDEVFGPYNQTAIIYDLNDHDKVSDFCASQEKVEKTTKILCYNNTINEPLASNEILGKFASLGKKVEIDENLIDFVYRIKYALNNNKITTKEILDKFSEVTTEEEANALMEKIIKSLGEYKKEDFKMTIEQFVTFLYDSAMNDDRIKELLEDTEIAEKLNLAKSSIDNVKDQLIGKNHGRVIVRTKLPAEGEETMDYIVNMKKELEKRDLENEVYMVGNSSMANEMSKSFGKESIIITIITAIAIYVVVAISFKSKAIPLILVSIIQTAVWITIAITGVTDGSIYFLSLIIVQSLLMGATIDYAIMFTEQYVSARKNGLDVQQSVVRGYNKSIQAILTSAGVLTIVTAIVGNFASSTAAKICKAISDGTFFSTILILLLLPALVAACDRFIIKRKKK